MDLETFEKLVDEHLFILNKNNLSKKGASEFRIFGKEALYKQLMLGGVVGRSEQLKPKQQICYKNNEPCKYDCSGLCKESYQALIAYNGSGYAQ